MQITMLHSLLAVAVTFVWGANFAAIDAGLNELPPLLCAALRFALVVFPALLFVPWPSGQGRTVIATGVLLGFVMFGGLFLALQGRAEIGHAAVIVQTQVPLTLVLAAFLGWQPLNNQQKAGVAVVVFGIVGLAVYADGKLTAVGLGLLLTSAVAWALTNLVLMRQRTQNSLAIMVWAFAIPPVPFLGLSLWLESPDPLPIVANTSLVTWAALAFMAYGSTLFAYAAWGFLLGRYRAANVTPFSLLIPIFATVLAGKSLSIPELAFGGVAIVGLGLCICRCSTTSLRWWRRSPQEIKHVESPTATECRSRL